MNSHCTCNGMTLRDDPDERIAFWTRAIDLLILGCADVVRRQRSFDTTSRAFEKRIICLVDAFTQDAHTIFKPDAAWNLGIDLLGRTWCFLPMKGPQKDTHLGTRHTNHRLWCASLLQNTEVYPVSEAPILATENIRG